MVTTLWSSTACEYAICILVDTADHDSQEEVSVLFVCLKGDSAEHHPQ